MAGPAIFKICLLITDNREDELFLVKVISSKRFDRFKSELFAYHPELIENDFKMYYKQGKPNGLFGNCFKYVLILQYFIKNISKYCSKCDQNFNANIRFTEQTYKYIVDSHDFVEFCDSNVEESYLLMGQNIEQDQSISMDTTIDVLMADDSGIILEQGNNDMPNTLQANQLGTTINDSTDAETSRLSNTSANKKAKKSSMKWMIRPGPISNNIKWLDCSPDDKC